MAEKALTAVIPDACIQGISTRPIEGDWPSIRLDATYVKARCDHHIVPVVVIVVVGVDTDGRREALGTAAGHGEAEPFWTEFLRSLARRGLRGTELAISDAHKGLKAAIAKVLSAAWQRCRVHVMRTAVAYAGKAQRRVKLHSTNPLERLNGEIKRRSDVRPQAGQTDVAGLTRFARRSPTKPPSSG